MKIEKIKKSWMIAHGHRIDAPFHLSDGGRTKLLLNNCPYDKTTLIEESKELFKGNIHRRVYVDSSEHGYPFLTASDMFKADLQSGKYISKKYSPYLKELTLKKDWIGITRSGTLGNVLYINSSFEGKIGTDDLIRINPSEKNIKRGFLYAYLKSKYGYALLTQSSYGGVVKHIEPEQIRNLPIPRFPSNKEDEINRLVLDAMELRYKASNTLMKAEDKFYNLNKIEIDEKWIHPSENKVKLGYKVRLSSSFNSTIKARNYSFRADYLINLLDSKKGKSLEKWVDTNGLTRGQGGFFKRIDSPYIKGIDIISQGDIHNLNPEFKQVINKNIKKSEIAKKGMIILPAAGTLGENEVFLRPMLICDNYEGKLLSEVVGKLNCPSLEDAAYLYTFLNSKIGFRILRTKVYGTNLMYPNWHLLKDINIPCIDENAKSIIAELTINAYKMRAEALNKERLAINLIETEIDSWQN